METPKSHGWPLLNRFLDPRSIIFGFAILHFLTMLTYLMRYQDKFSVVSTHWNPVRFMYEPVLLLLAAAGLLSHKMWGYMLAIVAGGSVIYRLLDLGLLATSAAQDRPIFSWYVLRTWLSITYASQPQYLLEVLFAGVVIVYAASLCSHSLSAARKKIVNS